VLLDIWRLVSYMALGDKVLFEDSYVLTDPLIYVPWIMMILLAFYALLLVRLNRFPLTVPEDEKIPQAV
jgi:hypothetical protein